MEEEWNPCTPLPLHLLDHDALEDGKSDPSEFGTCLYCLLCDVGQIGKPL